MDRRRDGGRGDPQPGERRPDDEPPAEQREPVQALGVAERGEDRPGREARPGDHDQPDPEGATAFHPQPVVASLDAGRGGRPGSRASSQVAGAGRRRRRTRPSAAGGGPNAAKRYTRRVSELTETAVVRRVPSVTEERLRVLSRRQPVIGPAGDLAGRLPARHPADRDGRFRLRLRRRRPTRRRPDRA